MGVDVMPAKGTSPRERWNPLLKSYPDSEKVNAVSIGAETMFTRLIAKADDYGNYWASPRKLLAGLFCYRWDNNEVDETLMVRWRNELVTCMYGPLIVCYSVNDIDYLHIINPRRRLRGDTTPEELVPREPANIEEKALSEHVTKTYQERTGNVPLDLDQDLDQDLDLEKQKPADSSEDFEQFWQHFKSLGRNDAKVKARKAWDTTLKGRPGASGHKPVEPSVLIEAANHYRMSCEAEKTEPKFVKQPATFLGPDRHWEDWREKRAPSGNGNGATMKEEERLTMAHDPSIYDRGRRG